MKIIPIRDKVLIKRYETESKSAGGIVLTGSSNHKSNRGRIIAIGKGLYKSNGERIIPEVKIGDVVIFNDNYNIKSEKIGKDELLIMSENDVVAIIES